MVMTYRQTKTLEFLQDYVRGSPREMTLRVLLIRLSPSMLDELADFFDFIRLEWMGGVDG